MRRARFFFTFFLFILLLHERCYGEKEEERGLLYIESGIVEAVDFVCVCEIVESIGSYLFFIYSLYTTYITLLVLLFPNIRAYYFYAIGAGPSFAISLDGLCYNLGYISVFT